MMNISTNLQQCYVILNSSELNKLTVPTLLKGVNREGQQNMSVDSSAVVTSGTEIAHSQVTCSGFLALENNHHSSKAGHALFSYQLFKVK